MRVFKLAGIALRAEQARISLRLRRGVVQLVVLGLALAFLLAGVIALHGVAFVLLDARLPRAGAVGLIAGIDLALALVLLMAASRSNAGQPEREAAALARAATVGIEEALTSIRLLESLLGVLLNRRD